MLYLQNVFYCKKIIKERKYRKRSIFIFFMGIINKILYISSYFNILTSLSVYPLNSGLLDWDNLVYSLDMDSLLTKLTTHGL